MTDTEKTPFVREDRYIVVKRKDLRDVPEPERHAFHVALEGVREHLPHRECLVVESDWPEHDVVWAALSPPSEPVLLRHAIAYAVRAQTGASPATGDARARAVMLLLSIDEGTVVTREPR